MRFHITLRFGFQDVGFQLFKERWHRFSPNNEPASPRPPQFRFNTAVSSLLISFICEKGPLHAFANSREFWAFYPSKDPPVTIRRYARRLESLSRMLYHQLVEPLPYCSGGYGRRIGKISRVKFENDLNNVNERLQIDFKLAQSQHHQQKLAYRISQSDGIFQPRKARADQLRPFWSL